MPLCRLWTLSNSESEFLRGSAREIYTGNLFESSEGFLPLLHITVEVRSL